jgi:DNA-directed RNA polymerase
MIHDDFGTYACDVPQLKDDIRKAMYKLYSEHKPLNELAEQLGIECNLKEGDYRLEDILQAEYFFD